MLFLFGCKRPVFVAACRGTGRAVTCEDGYVTGHIPVCGLEILVRHSVSACGVPETEDSSAQLVRIGIILVESDGGNTAVACYERSYSLSDEGAEIGERILSDGEPVVMRVRIDESGRNP